MVFVVRTKSATAQRRLRLSLPRTDPLSHLGMRQHHARIALQGGNIARAKLAAALGGDQQKNRLAHHRIDAGIGERFFLIETFIDGHDQLRDGPQPSKPRIASQQLKKMIRRMDRPNVDFINCPFGLEQNFVQMQQSIVKVEQRAPDRFVLWSKLSGTFSHHHDNYTTS